LLNQGEAFPSGHIFNELVSLQADISRAGTRITKMHNDDSVASRRASEMALAFGSLIRSRRRALNMRQHELALATGVGRRFLVELEAGKPSCQLGRSLMVAHALGITSADVPSSGVSSASATAEDLPEVIGDMEEPNGSPAGVF
jgi:DNA-binding XRE family transcriptional regulator